MFKELLPLLEGRTMILTAAKIGDALTVTIYPKRNGERDENPVGNTPLCVTGTAEELDHELPGLIAGYWLFNVESLDQALRRALNLRFRLGMFDPDDLVPFSKIPATVIDSPEHAALALRAARESIVLLKNVNHFLPLRHVKKIAVIGPSADLTRTLEGNYNATPKHPITPLIGMEQRFHGQSEILYAQGAQLTAGMPVIIESIALHPGADTNVEQNRIKFRRLCASQGFSAQGAQGGARLALRRLQVGLDFIERLSRPARFAVRLPAKVE